MLQYFWRSISILPHLKHTFSSSEWGVAPYNRAFVWVNDWESNLLKDRVFVAIKAFSVETVSFVKSSIFKEKGIIKEVGWVYLWGKSHFGKNVGYIR